MVPHFSNNGINSLSYMSRGILPQKTYERETKISNYSRCLSPIRSKERLKIELPNCSLWHYRLWSFQGRDTKLERFLAKNQHTQRTFLNFENWTNGEPQ